MKRYKTVEEYIEASDHPEELRQLRDILGKTPLEETVKWGAPVYTHKGKNVVGMGSFKSYFGIWFFQGALLEDSAGVLINAQEGRTKALRQWRFENRKAIKSRLLQDYVKEAIALVDAGRTLKPERKLSVEIPAQLASALDGDARAGAAFARLTPGKQREYAEYIATAKRDETKSSRLEKILPMIAEGIGLHDRYRKC